MTGWTPLHQRIVGSSVWATAYHVRIAWVTLLAITGKDGVAHVTLSGLARLANIKLDEARHALEVLSSPDEDTLTQENEGRRIERVETGWKLLNWETYKVLAKQGVIQEQNRKAQARWRDRHRPPGKEPTVPTASPPLGRSRPGNRPLTVEAVIEAGQVLNINESVCRKFWLHYEGTVRHDENGKPVWVTGEDGKKDVGNWRSLLQTWKTREEEMIAKEKLNQGRSGSYGHRSPKEAQREGPGAPITLPVQSFNAEGAKP